MYHRRCRPDGDPKGIQGSDHNLTQLKLTKLSIPARCFQRKCPAAFLGARNMLRQLSHVKNSGWSIVEGDHIAWFNDFNGDYGRLAARFLTTLSWVMDTARNIINKPVFEVQALALKYHPDKNPDCSECRALVRRELFWDVLDKVLGHPWAIFCLICLPWLWGAEKFGKISKAYVWPLARPCRERGWRVNKEISCDFKIWEPLGITALLQGYFVKCRGKKGSPPCTQPPWRRNVFIFWFNHYLTFGLLKDWELRDLAPMLHDDVQFPSSLRDQLTIMFLSTLWQTRGHTHTDTHMHQVVPKQTSNIRLLQNSLNFAVLGNISQNKDSHLGWAPMACSVSNDADTSRIGFARVPSRLRLKDDFERWRVWHPIHALRCSSWLELWWRAARRSRGRWKYVQPWWCCEESNPEGRQRFGAAWPKWHNHP